VESYTFLEGRGQQWSAPTRPTGQNSSPRFLSLRVAVRYLRGPQRPSGRQLPSQRIPCREAAGHDRLRGSRVTTWPTAATGICRCSQRCHKVVPAPQPIVRPPHQDAQSLARHSSRDYEALCTADNRSIGYCESVGYPRQNVFPCSVAIVGRAAETASTALLAPASAGWLDRHQSSIHRRARSATKDASQLELHIADIQSSASF